MLWLMKEDKFEVNVGDVLCGLGSEVSGGLQEKVSVR